MTEANAYRIKSERIAQDNMHFILNHRHPDFDTAQYYQVLSRIQNQLYEIFSGTGNQKKDV